MKSFVIVLVGLALVPAVVFSNDEKPAEDKPAVEKKAEAKVEPAPAVEAKQVLEVIEAFGAVANVFAGAVGGEVVGVDPLEQLLIQQFRPLSKTELNFVRAVCQPNAEQYKKIKAAGDVGLKVAAKKTAEIEKKMQQDIRAGEQPEHPDPRKLIADMLLRSVKQTLSADQANRYEAELEKRAAARKRAALLNLVAELDKDLVLTADQRGKLTEALNSNWKDAWCQQLEVFKYGDAYMSVLPDAQVAPILTEKQKQIWNGIPKQQNQIWGWTGRGIVQEIEVEEAVVVDAAKADDADKAEAKKEEKP